MSTKVVRVSRVCSMFIAPLTATSIDMKAQSEDAMHAWMEKTENAQRREDLRKRGEPVRTPATRIIITTNVIN
ncbi:hypothetical protein TSUD_41140 [Trifolium subterraneum]|nr:hypothetical protein TSUD_41140 [Trifolium subterraneum]